MIEMKEYVSYNRMEFQVDETGQLIIKVIEPGVRDITLFLSKEDALKLGFFIQVNYPKNLQQVLQPVEYK